MSRRGPARLQVVAVGAVKPPFAAPVREFEARVNRLVGLSVDEVRPEPLQRGGVAVRVVEAGRIRARVSRDAHAVALDPAASAPRSSDAFAAWLGDHLDRGRRVAFLIGGATGIDQALADECAERMGLGPLTMPHQLARLVLTEQLYRALTIIHGHPYAH
ncbi:MAG: 23S rRNA (pseudouridine(1915)-N(3))-methyltransferase RlmH [Thermoleophilia bacterium]|nr:23S rRNA (pseudouridine(1915)-N(3))-methyltransferase RlmH [Thermoleophilia bacterium]